ncbi:MULTISPECIES: electron transfer flavoprotein subunit alpha/FixB family protein [Comamonadaceae]|jgi:electron transfer flavoprotein alpha subunit|uniref:Electron transfer flavoprotein alpha subunit n=1 Tax=Hydrogenophaga laconesensis TaxID=1805971 RepID=A0ABU1VGC5_9BURK|nr:MULTISPECIES: FAD-binding protein [Comamonadaceae]MDO9200317.1 FAD-binding protein [Hydrogenophaga sp.]ODS64343.1 MAG: electron transfer flavoprotein subunit beta [Acidovorax sp. SCN 68-22]OGB22428.1 MAG: electron transfer flavoprotein subunit beta [Burkholderiales bacterium RIFCSPHIGHO2_12_FULL_65_48]EHL22251.1 Electron transfer flavoprotein subunit alpha [Acidovorax sp. NO-1]MDR7096395.1 electron transfer flavoprotein alpha subunit [Hydrogenophaga laconesensis]
MTTLIIAEHDNAVLKAATLNTIAAATRIGGDIHVLVAGRNCAAVAQTAAAVAGVSKVLHADAAHYEAHMAESLAELVRSRVRADAGYTHVLAPATAFGKNVLPRVAALLDASQVSDVIAIESPDTFLRPFYAGNALARVQSKDAIKVLSIRTTAFDPVGSGGTAAVETLDAAGDLGLTTLVGREVVKLERPELAAATVIVSGGRGLGAADKFHAVLEPLADKLGAAIGASRAAVDAGYAPNDYQVGQTGKIVAPQLYVAVGISGAIQHLAGMKDSKVIVAINKDAEAPIFQVADYGLVADLFTAVPELVTAL